MPIVAIAATLGLIAGLASGGSLRSLSETRFRWVTLLFVGLAVQVVFAWWTPEWLGEQNRFWLLVGSSAVVIVFMVANFKLPGMWIAALGLALNLLVITANRAMPVSETAAESFGGRGPSSAGAFKHEPLDNSTTFSVLADVIPIPPFKLVISIGDVVLASGILYLVFARSRVMPPGKHEVHE